MATRRAMMQNQANQLLGKWSANPAHVITKIVYPKQDNKRALMTMAHRVLQRKK